MVPLKIKIETNVKIDMSVANFNPGFLKAVIKVGAADHSEFICVHPPENLGAVAEGREVGLPALARERCDGRRELTKELLQRAEGSGFGAACVPVVGALDREHRTYRSKDRKLLRLGENPATYWRYPTNWKDIEWLGCSGEKPRYHRRDPQSPMARNVSSTSA